MTATLRFPQRVSSTKIWRLDASLLTDPADVATLKQAISDYFLLNNTPDVSPMTQWEAHKCVVHGHLLSIAARRKKEHLALIQTLVRTISRLEAQHKSLLAIEVANDLADTRTRLREELYNKARKRFMLSRNCSMNRETSREDYWLNLHRSRLLPPLSIT